MSVLLLRLAGPMQSWGTQSRFSIRDSGLEPSKSGVIGLLAAALGRSREKDISDLVSLSLGIRVDREGRLERDFHTALEVVKADGSKADTVVSQRYYLADACFLVGLEGETSLLQTLQQALIHPVWPLFLGRKSFVPGEPIALADGFCPGKTVLEALTGYPWESPARRPPDRLRLVLETAPGAGEPRMDVPLSFAERRFTVRHVRTDWLDVAVLVRKEGPPCS